MLTAQEKKASLKEIKDKIISGEYGAAFSRLCVISEPADDFLLQCKYASLYRSIPGGAINLKRIRIAVLATSTVKHFNDILSYWLAREGFGADIYEADYGAVQQEILNPKSGMYEFGPDIVMIFTNYRDVRLDVKPGASPEEARQKCASAVEELNGLWEALRQKSKCHIIQNNADLPYHRTLGNYEGMAAWGYLNMLRDFNISLARSARPGVTILDLDFISSAYGRRKWHDARYWYHSKHAFALDATGLVAYDAAKVISSVKGEAKKCLIMDLDNTLWGGVIGDDGIDGIALGNGPDGEAFVDFQKYILSLKERGVVLAVCSKNDPETAKKPFTSHPHMQIKLEDIVVFKADWNDKASSIKEIASALNVGLDSIVFVDDNPAERELVRGMLPMVSVPELPDDPSDYASALSSYSYFEIASFSKEDTSRTHYYRENTARFEFQKQFTGINEYLASLRMEMSVEEFSEFNIPRIAQLINKSNQFHLTTTRYTENEIRSMAKDAGKICRCFRLKDRFGDNGIIAAVIIEKKSGKSAYIDTWVMSCRILSRGAEEFICSEMISIAKENAAGKITGRYIPTKKNMLVSSLYGRLGFKMTEEKNGSTLWELELGGKEPAFATLIKKI